MVAMEDRFQGYIDGHLVLDASDIAFSSGRIGLASNVPATFNSFTVFKEPNTEVAGGGQRNAGRRSGSRSEMVLIKKIGLNNRHSGKSIRIGNLRGDGQRFLILAKGASREKGDDYNAITALSAMDLDGKILWSRGDPSGRKIA